MNKLFSNPSFLITSGDEECSGRHSRKRVNASQLVPKACMMNELEKL
jgi:hypothetical protein